MTSPRLDLEKLREEVTWWLRAPQTPAPALAMRAAMKVSFYRRLPELPALPDMRTADELERYVVNLDYFYALMRAVGLDKEL